MVSLWRRWITAVSLPSVNNSQWHTHQHRHTSIRAELGWPSTSGHHLKTEWSLSYSHICFASLVHCFKLFFFSSNSVTLNPSCVSTSPNHSIHLSSNPIPPSSSPTSLFLQFPNSSSLIIFPLASLSPHHRPFFRPSILPCLLLPASLPLSLPPSPLSSSPLPLYSQRLFCCAVSVCSKQKSWPCLVLANSLTSDSHSYSLLDTHSLYVCVVSVCVYTMCVCAALEEQWHNVHSAIWVTMPRLWWTVSPQSSVQFCVLPTIHPGSFDTTRVRSSKDQKTLHEMQKQEETVRDFFFFIKSVKMCKKHKTGTQSSKTQPMPGLFVCIRVG